MDRKIDAGVNTSTVVFSGDGKLLRGLCQDGKLRAWDAASGELKQTIAFADGDVAPVLTNTTLTTMGKDGAIKAWDLTTGKVSKSVTPSGMRARRATVAPDGQYFIGAYAVEGMPSANAIRTVEGDGKNRFTVAAGIGGISTVAISPDGASIVAASYDADVRAWSAKNGELLRLIDELPVSMFDMKFSPDGKWLAAAGADRTLYLYDTKTWRMARKLVGQPEMISAVAFSADGRMIATGGFSEYTQKRPVKVIIWDLASARPHRTVDAAQRVASVAFSPNGKVTAVSTGGKSIDLWQVAE
ncbi:MAG: hypothetical protein HYX27_09790 [Acidobacteria bacterium]|nr:hypothetical protein [Acidobacteriota bacterium]